MPKTLIKTSSLTQTPLRWYLKVYIWVYHHFTPYISHVFTLLPSDWGLKPMPYSELHERRRNTIFTSDKQ